MMNMIESLPSFPTTVLLELQRSAITSTIHPHRTVLLSFGNARLAPTKVSEHRSIDTSDTINRRKTDKSHYNAKQEEIQ
jgi:hypothetical protein